MSKRPSTQLTKKALYQKYGKHCMLCRCRKDLQYHHIIKFCDDGPTTVENGAVLCSYHHSLLHKNTNSEKRYNEAIMRIKRRV